MTVSTLLAAIKRALSHPDDVMLDHVPVQRTPRSKRDWRERALQKAAAKYGKPFKCAAQGLDREIMVAPETFATIKGGDPLPGKPWAKVTKIKAAK